MALEQFAQTIIPKFNVPGIEPWSHHFKSADTDYVHGLRKAFDDAGVHVVNIPVDVRVNLCGSQEDRKSGLATYNKWVDAAVILGSPSIRVHLPRNEKDGEISCAVSALKALAEYGGSKNIVINVENDNPDTEQPDRIASVLEAVNSPFLRALPDFCNSMLIHDDQSYNNQALARLFRLAFNISHVKDMEQDGQKTYRVDMDQIFAIAKKVGYRGYFSMEWEGTGDAYEGTRKLIEASLKNVG
jgi:sugar phosphate isomerase/epimerase